MGLAIPGMYFDGSTSMKLLVDHALTGSSDYTLFIAATPGHDATDPSTGSATNALITTSGVATADNALFGISQTRTALGTLTYLSRGFGSGFDGGPFIASEYERSRQLG
jgi:hypothetical protein